MVKKMGEFYSKSQRERVALTETAIKEKRTLRERWENLHNEEASHWSARSISAANYLKDKHSVVDFGCGTMNLEKALNPNQEYIPIDVVARDERTIVCDINSGDIPTPSAEAVACLGVLEYLFKPDIFLKTLSSTYKNAVVTYCVTDSKNPLTDRREHAWVNDFSQSDIEDILSKSDWLILDSEWVDDLQKIWNLKSKTF